jgi:hypothetical protein
MGAKIRRESVSPAERMSLHRRRRRNGLRCIRILLHETEIDSLIEKGFLTPERRHDQDAANVVVPWAQFAMKAAALFGLPPSMRQRALLEDQGQPIDDPPTIPAVPVHGCPCI